MKYEENPHLLIEPARFTTGSPAPSAPQSMHKMANFISYVIRASTISLAPVRQTAVPCLNHFEKNKCSGFIKVQRQDIPTSTIHWSCNKYDKSGSIYKWQESGCNLAEFAESKPDSLLTPIILTTQEYKMLLDSMIIDPTCETILFEATPLIGGIQITIPEDDLEYFVEMIQIFLNPERNKAKERLLDSILDKCDDLRDLFLEQKSL